MTVIAYRDGVMAADTLASDGLLKVAGMRKVVRGSDGVLYGVAGAAGICCAIARWVESGYRGDMPALRVEDQTADVLVVGVDGVISALTPYGQEDYPGAEYFAIGSGSAVAMGALHAGADAEGAVRAAIEHGLGCGGAVMAVRHDDV